MATGAADSLLVEDRFAGEHLGCRVYRLLHVRQAEDALAALSGVRHPVLVEAKVPVAEVDVVARLTAIGFRLIDTGIQLDLAVGAVAPGGVVPSSWRVRDAVSSDRAAIERVAGDNLTTSRFHLDPAIDPERATALKRAWAGNYFAGIRGQRMLVVEPPEGVRGFLLALEHGGEGVIDLVALDPPLRGSGALGRLVCDWVERAPALARLVVGTQASNVRSLRAYNRLGFRVAAATYVLHYHA